MIKDHCRSSPAHRLRNPSVKAEFSLSFSLSRGVAFSCGSEGPGASLLTSGQSVLGQGLVRQSSPLPLTALPVAAFGCQEYWGVRIMYALDSGKRGGPDSKVPPSPYET